jgi:hypothetical protein
MTNWVTPRTYVVGETMTAALMNTHIRDNMTYIYDNAGTVIGKRVVEVPVFSPLDTNVTGDGKAYLIIPFEYNGMNLINAQAGVVTVGAGVNTIQLARNRGGTIADILDTRITIDANENTSYTAANASVIGTANRDMLTGDMIRFDVDGASGLGMIGILTLQMP